MNPHPPPAPFCRCRLKESVATLQEVVRRADAPREVEKVFHQRISALEGKLEDIRGEVRAAADEILSDMPKLSDMDQVVRELEDKATLQDIKQLAQQQATLAQSVNGMAAWLAMRPDTADGAQGTGASATKFKCLTCDREMNTQTVANGNATLKGRFLPRLDSAAGQSAAPAGPGLR